MKKIKLYTTPTLEGSLIETYCGLVIANQVAGTGFLTDLTASFSDLFGGNSGAYRNQMDRLYADVIENISQQASALGANAVIGVRVDFDNISAKSMSMFMVSVQGTAVKLKNTESLDEKSSGIVTEDELECEYKKQVFAKTLQTNNYLSKEGWQYVLTHNMLDLSELLYQSYANALKDDMYGDDTRKNFPIYVANMNYDQAVSLMYGKDECFTKIIRDLHLFNAKRMLELARNEHEMDTVCELLLSDKATYNKEDLKDMQELADFLQNMPDTGKIEEVKGGIFSSSGLKFICQCGEKNDKDQQYCSNCARDIKGLNYRQRTIVDRYLERVGILQSILDT